ncbi:MAG TPA: prepilin-type N-terminal cleavage/methylation domain-containing protein, partial [Acidimicrobiales bacterium]
MNYRARPFQNRRGRCLRPRVGGGAPPPTAPGRHDQGSGERGFTLIELVIVASIIPLIIGAISAGLITILRLQSSVASRITASGDAQVLSSTFHKDVQSATSMTTLPSSTPQCGNSTSQLLGLQWGSGGDQTLVSYDSVPATVGATTTYSLVRDYCTFGSSTPSSTSIAAIDISGSQLPPCLDVANCTPGDNPPQDWTLAASVPAVKFVITEAGSDFTYTLLTGSRAWTPTVATGISVGPAFSPLTVLSSGTGLTLSNNSSITVNKSHGTNGSSVAIASPLAGSVSIGTGATLTASTLLTTDPLLNSVSPGAEPSPPTEYYSPQVADPLKNSIALPPPAIGSPTCSPAGSIYNCPPGTYTSLPSFSSGSTVTFTGGSGKTTEFTNTFVVPSNVTMTFNYGY